MEATATRGYPGGLTSQDCVQLQETLIYLVRQISEMLHKLTKLDDLSSMSDRSRMTSQTCDQLLSELRELHNLCIDNLSDHVRNTSINVEILVQNLRSAELLTIQDGLRNVNQTAGPYVGTPYASNAPRSAEARRMSSESLNIEEEIGPNNEINSNLGYLSEILQTVHNLHKSTRKILELTNKGCTESPRQTEEEIENVKQLLAEVRHIHDVMRGFNLDTLRGFCERVEEKLAGLTGEQYSKEQFEQTQNLMVRVLSQQEQINEKLEVIKNIESFEDHQKMFECVVDIRRKLSDGANRKSSSVIVDNNTQATPSEVSQEEGTNRTPSEASPDKGTNRAPSEASLEIGINREPFEVSPDEDTNGPPSVVVGVASTENISSGVLTHEAMLRQGTTSEHGGSNKASSVKDGIFSDTQEQTCLMTTDFCITRTTTEDVSTRAILIDDDSTKRTSTKNDLDTLRSIVHVSATEESISDVESVPTANTSLDDLATGITAKKAVLTTKPTEKDQATLKNYLTDNVDPLPLPDELRQRKNKQQKKSSELEKMLVYLEGKIESNEKRFSESLQLVKKEICEEIITFLVSSKPSIVEHQENHDQEERQAARISSLENELCHRLSHLENTTALHKVQLDTMVSRVDQRLDTLRKKIEVHAPSFVKLLLTGSPGVGKSSVGNSILGRNVFVSKQSKEPVTADIEVASGKQDGRFVTVVDTPGINLRDQQWNEWNRQALQRATSVVAGGYDAILLVLRFGDQLYSNDVKNMSFLKEILGDSFIRDYAIVIMTGGDDGRDILDQNHVSFEEWCEFLADDMMQLFEECQKRFLLFDNVSDDESLRNRQIKKLLDMVDDLKIGTQGAKYIKS